MDDYKNYFDTKFIKSLPSEPIDALAELLGRWRSVASKKAVVDPEINDYVRLFSFVRSLAHEAGIPLNGLETYDFDGMNVHGFMDLLDTIFAETFDACESAIINREIAREDGLADEFQEIRLHVELVEFTEEEFNTVQELTNELRDMIVNTANLDENHRSRLLSRLEAFQSELHKTMSNLDKFWAFFGEAGVRVGEFGENIQPFTDRLREMSDIVLKALDIPKALTGNIGKLLPSLNNDNEEDE